MDKEKEAVLENWLENHLDNPYLNPEDELWLLNKTELEIFQIRKWFADARQNIYLELCKKKGACPKNYRSEDDEKCGGPENSIPNSIPFLAAVDDLNEIRTLLQLNESLDSLTEDEKTAIEQLVLLPFHGDQVSVFEPEE